MKKIEYFNELATMYDFIHEHGIREYDYKFTFAYGYQLIYWEE